MKGQFEGTTPSYSVSDTHCFARKVLSCVTLDRFHEQGIHYQDCVAHLDAVAYSDCNRSQVVSVHRLTRRRQLRAMTQSVTDGPELIPAHPGMDKKILPEQSSNRPTEQRFYGEE